MDWTPLLPSEDDVRLNWPVGRGERWSGSVKHDRHTVTGFAGASSGTDRFALRQKQKSGPEQHDYSCVVAARSFHSPGTTPYEQAKQPGPPADAELPDSLRRPEPVGERGSPDHGQRQDERRRQYELKDVHDQRLSQVSRAKRNLPARPVSWPRLAGQPGVYQPGVGYSRKEHGRDVVPGMRRRMV
jgi:hypothetical protein